MRIKTGNTYNPTAHAEQMAAARGGHFSRCYQKMGDHRNECVARRRWQTGKASHCIVPGRFTSKIIYHRDGSRTVLTRQPDGTIQRRELARTG